MQILGSIAGFILTCYLVWGLFWIGAIIIVAIGSVIWYILSSPVTWIIVISLVIWFLLDERKRKV